MRIDSSYVLAEPDPRKISAVARRLMEIYRVIFARTGLGSDVKLDVIELEDRIQRNVLGATKDLAPPRRRQVRALQSDGLSIMPATVVGFHTVHEGMDYAIDPAIALAI